jgi:hypothetical protein
METFLITAGIILAIVLLIWWVYGLIRQSLCCGTGGCNLVSDKTKKKMLARREKKAQRKNKACDTCPKNQR